MHPGSDIAAAFEHHHGGRLAEAGQCCRAALALQPDNADALHLLGLLAHYVGDDVSAVALIRQATARAPRAAGFHANLGVVLLRQRLAAEAAVSLRTAIRLQPTDFATHANLGVALFATGDYEGAARAAGAALRFRPGDPATLCNRALALQAAGHLGPALADIDAALVAAPGLYTAHLARGSVLLAMGQASDALAAFDAAIPLGAEDTRARQARIAAMNYLPDASMAAIGAVARKLAPKAMRDLAPFLELDRSDARPLRIGYVSADFRDHPVGYFLHSVLEARDRADAVVFCYDNGRDGDEMTRRLQAAADHWRPIANLDDHAAAALVRSDRIDILVDLAGHTQGNRLGVFARRAAPVQATWLGYFGTTGGAAIDVVIADGTVVPVQDEAAFTERVVRLPHSYLCFSPPAEAGPVTLPQAGRDRPVTFGCFNNRAKLGPVVLSLWARVLAAVPGARLFLKSAQYADKAVRRAIIEAFKRHGIGPERLLFEPASPIGAMFAAYGRVDIALDPFPFAGGATTAQALWMGVPVVSLAGKTWAGRQGASLLAAAGFRDWVAEDEDGYVAIAARLAADRPGLRAIRSTLRGHVAASPLCQADQFAEHLHAAYRAMWRDYLEKSVSS